MFRFDYELVNSIVSHMNEDHADAVQLYLQVYAGVAGANKVLMTSIDSEGMDIAYERAAEPMMARVAFDPPLQSAEEVRPRLVTMAKTARQQLQN